MFKKGLDVALVVCLAFALIACGVKIDSISIPEAAAVEAG
jgi:hypothetical protein